MSIALWSIQTVLAALFIFTGVVKLVTPLDQIIKQSGLPGWLLLFIASAEILGAIGLILPALLRIYPLLTPIAACGLFIIMIGATITSLPGAIAILPFVVGVLTGFVAYGRLRLRPIRARTGA
jgi:uncharacterized membrane protein YphA (DoxX/SURF4 family)